MHQRGYTLTEILIVFCFFMVVLSVTLFPWPSAIAKHQLERTGRQLVADIRCLEQLAITEGNSYYNIRFSSVAGDHYYELRVAEGQNMKRIKRVNLPVGTEFAGFTINGNTMGITAAGTSANPGTITLCQRSINKYLYIKVAVTTGRVRMTYSNSNQIDEK